MVEYKQQAHIKGIPRDVLIHAIEMISESLVDDARQTYGTEWGFYSNIAIDKPAGIITVDLKFIPFHYKFKWLVAKEETGCTITLIGSTPGSWYEFVLDMNNKIRNVVETQWAAILNFSIGFASGIYYIKGGKKVSLKEHLGRARSQVTKRTKAEHKKTVIDSKKRRFFG